MNTSRALRSEFVRAGWLRAAATASLKGSTKPGMVVVGAHLVDGGCGLSRRGPGRLDVVQVLAAAGVRGVRGGDHGQRPAMPGPRHLRALCRPGRGPSCGSPSTPEGPWPAAASRRASAVRSRRHWELRGLTPPKWWYCRATAARRSGGIIASRGDVGQERLDLRRPLGTSERHDHDCVVGGGFSQLIHRLCQVVHSLLVELSTVPVPGPGRDPQSSTPKFSRSSSSVDRMRSMVLCLAVRRVSPNAVRRTRAASAVARCIAASSNSSAGTTSSR